MTESDDMERPAPLCYPCATIGCDARVALGSLRIGAGGTYCPACFAVERAVLGEADGQVLLAARDELLKLRGRFEFAAPYPEALPCLGCRGRPRPAMSGTLWCSPICERSVRAYSRRSFRLVRMLAVTLPEHAWRRLVGLGEGTYRMRRRRIGVLDALALPLARQQSRAARVGARARRGLPPLDDHEDLRSLIASMKPRIRTFT